MTSIATARRTPTRKPEGLIDINWGHSLAKGLRFAVCPSGARDLPRELVTCKLPSVDTGDEGDFNIALERGALPAGEYQRAFKANGSGVLTFGRTLADEIAGPGTIFAEARFDNDGASQAYLFYSGENGLGNGFGITLDDAVRVTNGFCLHGDNAAVDFDPAFDALGTNAHGKYHRFALAWSGSQILYYSQRRLFDSFSSGFVPSAQSNRVSKLFGFRDGGARLTGGIGELYIYNRALALDEYRALYDNPFQIFKPMTRHFLMPAAAGGGVARHFMHYARLRG